MTRARIWGPVGFAAGAAVGLVAAAVLGAPLAPTLVTAGLLLVGLGWLGVEHLRLAARVQEASETAAEHAALHRVAEAALAEEDVFAVASEALAAVLGADGATVMRLGDRQATVLGSWDRQPSPIRAGFVMPLEPGGLLEPLVTRGQDVRIDAHEPDRGSLVERLGYRTLAASPIRDAADRVWGVVAVSTRRDHTLAPQAGPRLTALAALVQVAIVDAYRRACLVRDASTDPLTGLLNRRSFDERLEAELAGARSTARPLALALIDIDRFKAVNDTHGHAAGDRVLVAVAALLASRLRGSDVVARIGGDEFAVLLPGTDAARAQVLLDEMRAAGADLLSSRAGAVTLSIGVTDSERTAAEAGALLASADEALYRSKAAGRDACTVAWRAG